MKQKFKQNELVPELSVSNFEKSLRFYKLLGFKVEYQRRKEGFGFFSLGKSQIIIDEIGKTRTWNTGKLDYHPGRGINSQIKVNNIEKLISNLKKNKIKIYMQPEDKWYKKKNMEIGQKQFLVQDPDGYLLRFFEDLGTREKKVENKEI